MSKVQTSIKTFLRIRPPATDYVYREPGGGLVCGDKTYRFTHVFGPDAGEEEIFERIGLELVDNAIAGYNSTLFAYGQTGTGKTYTMTGGAGREGLVQRAVGLLFRTLRQQQEGLQFLSVRISYCEVYNETIRDLLAERENRIVIREFAKTGFFVEGLESLEVTDEASFCRELKRGMLKRAIKATKMNESSSRSHSILTVSVGTQRAGDETACLVRVSKLNFVDLAGSEKQKQTEVTGAELREASSINKSLTTLSLVICKLTEKTDKSAKPNHIPYRESVLTKILKDSLGGNAVTSFIGTISSQKAWIAETLSTLLFLQRLKSVKNMAEVNQKIEGREEDLVKKISELQKKMQEMEIEIGRITEMHAESQARLGESQMQIKELQQQLTLRAQLSFFGNCVDQTQLGTPEVFSVPSDHESIGLSVIPEQPEKEAGTQQYQNYRQIVQTEVKPGPGSKRIGSERVSGSQKVKNFWQMQNEFLRKQIEKYGEEDEKYIRFIDLITVNINKLRFDEVQMVVLRSQAERIRNVEGHLQDYKEKFQELVVLADRQQTNLLRQREECRSLQLESISKRSIYLSNQRKYKSELQEATLRYQTIQNQMKVMQLKKEEELLLLQQALKNGETQRELLKVENIRLNSIIELYQQEMKKIKEDQSDNIDVEYDRLEEQNEKLLGRAAELQGLIENDLMPEIQRMETRIKNLEDDRQLLIQELQQEKQRIFLLEDDLGEVKERSAMLESQFIPSSETCQVGGQHVTMAELLQLYNNAIAEIELNKQRIDGLLEQLDSQAEELSEERVRLENQKEASKQAMTYLNFQLKVKRQENEKLQQDCTIIKQLYEDQQRRLQEKHQQQEQQKSCLIEASIKIERLERLEFSNNEFEERLINVNQRASEIEDHYKAQIARLQANWKAEKEQLEKACKAQNANFQACLRNFIAINKLYRSEQYYFYRCKSQYEESERTLRKENQRLRELASLRPNSFSHLI